MSGTLVEVHYTDRVNRSNTRRFDSARGAATASYHRCLVGFHEQSSRSAVKYRNNNYSS